MPSVSENCTQTVISPLFRLKGRKRAGYRQAGDVLRDVPCLTDGRHGMVYGKARSNLVPVQCSFSLNGKPMSLLTCAGVGVFPAYSGSGQYTNVPSEVNNRNNGPLPQGEYYIVDRESGGRLGVIREFLQDLSAGTRRGDWLSLYRNDGVIDDVTSINGIMRGSFRLHPVGYWGISEGCVTLPGVSDFYRLRDFLKAQPPAYVNGMRYYGVLVVK